MQSVLVVAVLKGFDACVSFHNSGWCVCVDSKYLFECKALYALYLLDVIRCKRDRG